MITKGLFAEYFEFRDSLHAGKDMFDGQMTIPIGFKQIEAFYKEMKGSLKENKASLDTVKGGMA